MALNKNISNKIIDGIIYIILFIMGFISLMPILHIFAVSFSNNAIASAGIVTIYPLGFNLESYKRILEESAFLNALGISVIRVVMSTVLCFFVSIITAYPLSKDAKEFKARKIYVFLLMFTMMFTPALIPWYLNMRNLNLIGNIWALVLPGAVSQFLIILVINFFRSIPKALDESGSIDGAGPWYKLFRIFVPLSTPVLATITLFIIVWNWNAFFDGLILMDRTSKYPLQTYIQQLVSIVDPNLTDLDKVTKLLAVSDRTLNAAKIVITMIPILVLYPLLQRYFVKGIMLGSVKE